MLIIAERLGHVCLRGLGYLIVEPRALGVGERSRLDGRGMRQKL